MTEYERRKQQVIYDKKWHLVVRRSRLFRYVPFVDAVLGAGSLAVGNVTEKSDLDVLVLSRTGRIFTSRLCSIIVFSCTPWRRKKLDHKEDAQDKICLNHFVTPARYEAELKNHEYWKALYQGLRPIYGAEEVIQAFFKANEAWAGKNAWQFDTRYQLVSKSAIAAFFERILSGKVGEFVEQLCKRFQVARIERGVKAPKARPRQIVFAGARPVSTPELPPRIIYTDTELQFHPEPLRITSL
jgi:hypothetical protein